MINVTTVAAGTPGGIPPAIQAYYDRNLLERAVPADVHGRWGQARPIKTRSGNQIKFRRYEALAAATVPLQEGVTPAGTGLTVTDSLATLAEYGAFITVSDIVTLTNQDAVLTEAGEVLGDQAGLTTDLVRRDVLVAGTNVIFTNGTQRSQVNTVLTTVALRTAIRTMARQNAKFVRNMILATTAVSTRGIRPAYIGIVHPDTTAQLESLVGYVPVSEYSNAMRAEDDEVGAYRNIRFFQSTNAKVFPDSGLAVGADGMISTTGVLNDVYATLIIADNSYGVVPLAGHALENIIKPLGSGGTSDPLNQRATSGWKSILTTAILNQNWLIRIEHTNLTTLA